MEGLTKAFIPRSSGIIIGDPQNLGKLVIDGNVSPDLSIEPGSSMTKSYFDLPTSSGFIKSDPVTILETEHRIEPQVPSTVLPEVSLVIPPSSLSPIPKWIPVKFWTADLLGNYPKFLEQSFEIFSGLDLDMDGFGDTSQTVTTSRLQGWLDLDDYDGEIVQISANILTDSDGINISDAVAVLKHIVGLVQLDGIALVAADVNQDSAVNITDAVQVLKIIVGLETQSKLVLADPSYATSIVVDPPFSPFEADWELTAFVLGDVDGNYSDII